MLTNEAIEVHLSYLRAAVESIQAELPELRKEIKELDKSLSARMDAQYEKLNEKIDAQGEALSRKIDAHYGRTEREDRRSGGGAESQDRRSLRTELNEKIDAQYEKLDGKNRRSGREAERQDRLPVQQVERQDRHSHRTSPRDAGKPEKASSCFSPFAGFWSPGCRSPGLSIGYEVRSQTALLRGLAISLASHDHAAGAVSSRMPVSSGDVHATSNCRRASMRASSPSRKDSGLQPEPALPARADRTGSRPARSLSPDPLA